MSLRICPSGPGKGHAFVGGMVPEKGDDYCQADCVRILGSLPGSCFLGREGSQEVGVILDRAKILVGGTGREEGGSTAHINTRTHTCVHSHSHTHTNMRTYSHMSMHTRVHAGLHTHTHARIYTHTHQPKTTLAHPGASGSSQAFCRVLGCTFLPLFIRIGWCLGRGRL